MLTLIRTGAATTRAEIMDQTGLSRSTVAQRLAALMARDLVVPAGGSNSTGGRPATLLQFNSSAGVVLACAIGATGRRVGIVDLGGRVLASREVKLEIADGPEAILTSVAEDLEDLLKDLDYGKDRVWGIGVGVPGPVEFATGRPVSPPIMPGWDGYPVADWLQERFDAPALVDNDVNVMAVGERGLAFGDCEQFLFVKVGLGVGAGIVADGHLYRGAQGCAGDIGHIYIPGHDDVLCACGNIGCLEAVVGGSAIAARLSAAGLPAIDARQVVEHALVRQPLAVREVREAGRELGRVLASLVNFFNPSVMAIGGALSVAGDDLLAGVREEVYRRSPPLATRDLRIVRSAAGSDAGMLGAAAIITEKVLDGVATG